MDHFCFVNPPLANLPIQNVVAMNRPEECMTVPFIRKEEFTSFDKGDPSFPLQPSMATLGHRSLKAVSDFFKECRNSKYCRFVVSFVASIVLVFCCATFMYLSTGNEETDLPLYHCLRESDLATRSVFKIDMEANWKEDGTAPSEVYVEVATTDRRIVASGMLISSTSIKNLYTGNVRAFIDKSVNKFENWYLMKRSAFVNKIDQTPFMEDYIQLRCNFMIECDKQPLHPHLS